MTNSLLVRNFNPFLTVVEVHSSTQLPPEKRRSRKTKSGHIEAIENQPNKRKKLEGKYTSIPNNIL